MAAHVVRADARRLPLPDASVDLIVTSPPYFKLRSYEDDGEHMTGQLGDEDDPAAYVAALLDCTAEWMRVLKPAGSMWVNLGDKYAERAGPGKPGADQDDSRYRKAIRPPRGRAPGIRAKSLMGLPWRYALGAVDELGLILRQEVVWEKPNGMPESVTDRGRRSHEQWFHLVKSPRYYTAVDYLRLPAAVADPSNPSYRRNKSTNRVKATAPGQTKQSRLDLRDSVHPLGKLPGSVWTISTEPLILPAWLPQHFAAFPTEWPRRLIAGYSPTGLCTGCGEGRQPVTELTGDEGRHPGGGGTYTQMREPGERDTNLADAALRPRVIVGERCACGAAIGLVPDLLPPTVPAVVLDPFGGTGTTALVADMLGRVGISADLSQDYGRSAQWRTTDPRQRARAARLPTPPPVNDDQGELW